jgi:hypothetical protein
MEETTVRYLSLNNERLMFRSNTDECSELKLCNGEDNHRRTTVPLAT